MYWRQWGSVNIKRSQKVHNKRNVDKSKFFLESVRLSTSLFGLSLIIALVRTKSNFLERMHEATFECNEQLNREPWDVAIPGFF